MNPKYPLIVSLFSLSMALTGCITSATNVVPTSSSSVEDVVSSSIVEDLSSSSMTPVSSSSTEEVSSSSYQNGCLVVDKNFVNLAQPQDATGDAATASSVYSSSYPAWQAFDKADIWTQWISDHVFPGANAEASLTYQFSVPTRILAYRLHGRFDTLRDRLPKAWRLLGSNDGIDWDILDSQSGIEIKEEWISETPRTSLTFGICNPGEFSQYSLQVTEVNGSTVVDLIEVELLGIEVGIEEPAILRNKVPTMAAGATNGVIVSSNSQYSSVYPAWNAFDRATAWTQFISGNHFRPFTEAVNLDVEFPEATSIVAYALKGRFDSLKDRLPKAWTLEGSSDGEQWNVIDTQTGKDLDYWASEGITTEARFDLTAEVSFKHYRLSFTEVNGSSVVDLIEVQLLGY